MAELLIVDNDTRITELIAWFLVRHGHRVRTAASFAEARARIEEAWPDLMLSDIELGAESAREALPALAREGKLPPTLVVSGYLDRDLIAVLAAIPGVVGTLAKPFDLAALEKRVESCLAALRPETRPTFTPAVQVEEKEGWVDVTPLAGPASGAGSEGRRR